MCHSNWGNKLKKLSTKLHLTQRWCFSTILPFSPRGLSLFIYSVTQSSMHLNHQSLHTWALRLRETVSPLTVIYIFWIPCYLIGFSIRPLSVCSPLLSLSQVLHADLATADAWQELACFERLCCWLRVELLIYGGQPEALLVSKVVASAFGPVALYEWCCAEVLQARTGRRQGLTSAFVSCCGVLQGQRWKEILTRQVRSRVEHLKMCFLCQQIQ